MSESAVRTEMSLRKVQAEELDLLCMFKSFCEARGLQWSLAYGTLLGAVRHKGFIPWDDDVDILMPREDYDRFLKEPLNNEFADTIVPGTGEPWLFAKLCSKRTLWNETYTKHSDRLGVFIDVFPWDTVDENRAASLYKKARNTSRFFYYGYAHDYSDNRYANAKGAMKRAIGAVSRVVPKERYLRKLDSLVPRDEQGGVKAA
ncbi:LicD family protein [Paratractidigestivibacter sp.]|uniref:LicD family protein n=1 Tax=Paratractidigestivibacter sp. TaxID=2847316 RepID=UPI002AC8D0CA|nr:LicD family protein [Paratractidigestivibacter sp.]